MFCIRSVFRPHRSSQYYVDAVCCYTDGVVWSVCHDREPRKNGWTDRDAVWDVDSGGPREPCVRWRARSPDVKG